MTKKGALLPQDEPQDTQAETTEGGNGAEKNTIVMSEQEERAQRIMRYHFDLELLQRWREVRTIEEELERSRLMRTLLEKLVLNEYVYGMDAAADLLLSNPLTSGRSTAFSKASSSNGRATNSAGGESPPAQTEPQAQYELLADGTVVRLRCPKCGADRFRSMLGFLNHCRIHCRLVFSSPEERLQRCGVPVGPGEGPSSEYWLMAKHPSQIKQERDLALIRANVLGPSYVSLTSKEEPESEEDFVAVQPRIAEVDEELDLGIGHEAKRRKTIHEPIREWTGSSSSLSVAAPDTITSRFYRKYDLLVGNSAARLPPASADGKNTHRWRLYLQSPRQEQHLNDEVRSPFQE